MESTGSVWVYLVSRMRTERSLAPDRPQPESISIVGEGHKLRLPDPVIFHTLLHRKPLGIGIYDLHSWWIILGYTIREANGL